MPATLLLSPEEALHERVNVLVCPQRLHVPPPIAFAVKPMRVRALKRKPYRQRSNGTLLR
jgi:hypothetical protein